MPVTNTMTDHDGESPHDVMTSRCRYAGRLLTRVTPKHAIGLERILHAQAARLDMQSTGHQVPWNRTINREPKEERTKAPVVRTHERRHDDRWSYSKRQYSPRKAASIDLFGQDLADATVQKWAAARGRGTLVLTQLRARCARFHVPAFGAGEHGL